MKALPGRRVPYFIFYRLLSKSIYRNIKTGVMFSSLDFAIYFYIEKGGGLCDRFYIKQNNPPKLAFLESGFPLIVSCFYLFCLHYFLYILYLYFPPHHLCCSYLVIFIHDIFWNFMRYSIPCFIPTLFCVSCIYRHRRWWYIWPSLRRSVPFCVATIPSSDIPYQNIKPWSFSPTYRLSCFHSLLMIEYPVVAKYCASLRFL